MKNHQKGFIGIAIAIIAALGILGFGAYKIFHMNATVQDNPNVTIGNFPSSYQPADHTNIQAADQTQQTATTSTAAITSVSKYVDPNHYFSLSYPLDFVLTSNLTPDQKVAKSSYMGVCALSSNPDNVGITAFCYTGNQKSDGFVGAALVITPDSSTTQQDCAKPEFDVGSKGQTTTSINGVTFYENQLGDAGLGHYLDIDSYRTYHNHSCYTLDLKVESDRGTSEKGLSADFSAMMQAKMKSILSTFQFLN